MKEIKRYVDSYKFYITVFISMLCFLTTLTSVGFGALNRDLQVSGYVEYRQDMGNMMKSYTSSGGDFHSYRDSITTVDFLDNKNIPDNAVQSWDVSYYSGDKKVMAWIIDDPNNSGFYKLYIGADGDVVANYDSSYIFYRMNKMTTINLNNNFDTSKCTDMSYMFALYTGTYHYSTPYLTELTTINGLQYLDTSKVTNMAWMFRSCDRLTSLNLSSFNTSNVTNMESMFEFCRTLTSLNVSYLNTINVTNMSSMFGYCEGLTSLNVSTLNTSKVTNMYYMFGCCKGLTSINISTFNTSKVTDMSYMFTSCSAITSFTFGSIDTSQVTNMRYMFPACKNLITLDLSIFNTSKVTDMEGMFTGDIKLKNLNLSNFDTSKVTHMHRIFGGENNSDIMTIETLDLRSFSLDSAIQIGDMFFNCRYLTQIKISSKWNASNVPYSDDMFEYCNRLPNFNSNYIDKTKAIPTTQGGYLTLV